jgi:cytochrome c-type biogenesis protein CcmH
MVKAFLCGAVFYWATAACWAGIDTFEFSSEENRQRYMVLVDELRCPKCKNNNLSGSNSMIAMDLKREIHNLVESGATDEKIVDFMVMRYGDFVLYRPRLNQQTLLLWGAPVAVFLLGVLVVGLLVRRRTLALRQPEAALTDEEQLRLAQLVNAPDTHSIPPSKKNK